MSVVGEKAVADEPTDGGDYCQEDLMLCSFVSSGACLRVVRGSDKVVKFMVNVKLIEKRVNNHVGRVIVQNPMIHSKACGRNVTSEERAYMKPPASVCTCCPARTSGSEAFMFVIELRLGVRLPKTLVGLLRLELKGEEDVRPAIEGGAGRTANHEEQTLLLQLALCRANKGTATSLAC